MSAKPQTKPKARPKKRAMPPSAAPATVDPSPSVFIREWVEPQQLELFFAAPPHGSVVAVLLCGKKVTPEAIGLAYRLVGPHAMMAGEIGTNWSGVLVCTEGFAQKHKATPHVGRPDHVSLELLS